MTTSTKTGIATAPALNSCRLSDFGAYPDVAEDATPAVRAALAHCREKGVRSLTFEPGRYDFWPERATEEYLFVSNNDEGLKRIAFPLVGFDHFEIAGGGADFVFHGYVVPFLVRESRHLAIKDLTIDFARPFHSEGKVLAVTAETVDLEFSDEFPYAIRHGVLVFTDGTTHGGRATTVTTGEVLYPFNAALAFDPIRRETAYMAWDRYGLESGVAAEEIGPRQVRLRIADASTKPGDVLVLGAAQRAVPGFVISDSRGLRLEKISLYHCGGMGVIAQRSADIELEQVRVTPPPGSRRIVSITADATHFVNCTGRITMRDCVFENQKDDATNVHGLYAQVTQIIAPNQIEVRLVHPQQAGIDFIRPGTRLEIVDGPSLVSHGETVVVGVVRLNKEITRVTLAAPLPTSVKVGDSVADADANTAEVLIENCLIRGNRARGILLGSRGRTTITGNTFHTPGSAILFEGDASYWFEQAGVREVIIRANTFDNCNYGVWGTACIEVKSGIVPDARAQSRYHQNIVIEDNLFRVFAGRGVLALYAVDGLIFRNNRLERTEEYPGSETLTAELCVVEASHNILVEPPRELGGEVSENAA